MIQAVILAGGLGSRLSEETQTKPKPLVEVGGMPIIWHIMKTYSHWGVNRFIICAGYRSILLKEFFTQFSSMAGDVIIHANGEIEFKNSKRETWEISPIYGSSMHPMVQWRL